MGTEVNVAVVVAVEEIVATADPLETAEIAKLVRTETESVIEIVDPEIATATWAGIDAMTAKTIATTRTKIVVMIAREVTQEIARRTRTSAMIVKMTAKRLIAKRTKRSVIIVRR